MEIRVVRGNIVAADVDAIVTAANASLIGCGGAFGYPLFEACQVSAQSLRSAATSLRLCLLVAFDERTEKFWDRALAT